MYVENLKDSIQPFKKYNFLTSCYLPVSVLEVGVLNNIGMVLTFVEVAVPRERQILKQ